MAEVLDGIDALDTFLMNVVDCLENPQAAEPLRKALEECAGELGRHMAAGESPTGEKHAPLSPAYLLTREGKGPPLINGGDLLLSLIGDGSGHIEEVGDDEATLGTVHNKNDSDPPIAVVHQLGSSKRNIPARPFIGVNDFMGDRTAELVMDHVYARIGAL